MSVQLLYVVGARPNFVKAAPVFDAVRAASPVSQLLVHTGQHYDPALSADVLADLGLPEPDRFLGVGSGTHADQTGRTLIAVEQVLMEERPELVVVSGDVNATLAASLAAAKLGIPIAHIESGLRSRDRAMPEEINRILTDRLAEILLVHSADAIDNLTSEGVPQERIHYVGNTMIDSLRRFEAVAAAREVWKALGVERGGFLLVTLHRPTNVDDDERLGAIAEQLALLAARFPVVFPIHPRTRVRLTRSGLLERLEQSGVVCLDPLGYLDFLSLEAAAGALLTDSGGIQEEASALGVRCYTFRANTERPVTITHGTNTLLGDDPETIRSVELSADAAPVEIPLWDGRAGQRAATVLLESLADGGP